MGFGLVSFWEKLDFEGGPPLPYGSLDWRGFAEKAWQDLERQRIRCKIFTTKELRAFSPQRFALPPP